MWAAAAGQTNLRARAREPARSSLRSDRPPPALAPAPLAPALPALLHLHLFLLLPGPHAAHLCISSQTLKPRLNSPWQFAESLGSERSYCCCRLAVHQAQVHQAQVQSPKMANTWDPVFLAQAAAAASARVEAAVEPSVPMVASCRDRHTGQHPHPGMAVPPLPGPVADTQSKGRQAHRTPAQHKLQQVSPRCGRCSSC